jgi:hypothetical protein
MTKATIENFNRMTFLVIPNMYLNGIEYLSHYKIHFESYLSDSLVRAEGSMSFHPIRF